MLTVDLGRLDREGRVAIDEDVPAEEPLLAGTGLSLRGALAVRLEARKVGVDVLVEGRLKGELDLECRRCLEPVVVEVDEPVSLLFRHGTEPLDAERSGIYPLPDRTRQLDLAEPIREHLVLGVPAYVVCREACRGLCPRCGANLNEGTCDCRVDDGDDRWAPLRQVKFD